MSRLRIAVPPAVAGLQAGTGHGAVWRHVLDGLGQVAEIQTRERPPRLRFGRQPDVWLADGHTPPPETGGAPLVVVVHEASWADPELAQYLHPEFATALGASTEAAVRAADVVLTGSEATRDQIARVYGIDPDRIRAVPYGVDLHIFRPEIPGGRDQVGKPYVLFVGILHPRKNIDGLRQAMVQLADHGLPHVLAIVGSPARDRPDPTDLIEAATAELPGRPGRVIAIDNPTEPELAALYAGAAAFCLPSWFEGFGLPALEALACGAPVVVSDRGSLPEVVGDAGIVTTPEPDAIAAALANAIDIGPLRMGGPARERAETMPWSRTVDGWHSVLREVARP